MFVAFAVDRALGFLLIVLITKWWSPTEVGFWTQAVTFTGALATIASMGLYQAHIRFAEESAEPSIRHSLQLTILSTTTVALLLAALVAAAVPGGFARSVFSVATETRLLAAVFALALSELWTEFVTTQLRAEVDARGAAMVLAGKAVLRVVLVGTLALTVRGAAGASGASGASGADVARVVGALAITQWLATVAVMLARLGAAHWFVAGFAPGRELFRRALRMAVPMIPAAIAAQGFVTTERFVLARTSPETLAHFNIGQQFASNAMMAYVILGSMFYPMLVRVWREGKAQAAAPVVSGALMTYLVVSLPALLVLPLVSRELVPLLTTRFYEVGAWSFLALMIGAAGLGVHQMAGYVFYVTERTWELLALLGFGLLVKIVCALALVARFGEQGAVLAWAIAGTVLALATLVRARHLVRFHLPLGRLARVVGSAVLAATIVAAVRLAVGDRSRALVLSAAAVALVIYAFLMRNELRYAAHVRVPE
jgi:O-antigen/teichoic acid export membrane protein